jgi:hypothetical protein
MPRKPKALLQNDPLQPRPKRKPAPFAFILEALASLSPEVRPMFSAHAVYIGDRILFMLRDSLKSPVDNGLWLVFSEGFEFKKIPAALKKEFPSIRPIQLLEGAIKHWLLLPSDHPSFEQDSLHACDLALAHDPRLGRIPKSRQSRKQRT